ncbi:MAG: iron-sulfur cluster assembly scaffold protein [Gammaproteobacteria bacterium]|nr:iron-sulfur cluster assembly scaffold protein [Gammaproteobacteria bacterium]
MEYSKAVLSRFRRPQYAGRPCLPADQLVIGRAGKHRTGSDVVFYLQIIANQIHDARFEAYGCPHTIAAADYMAERMIGRPVDQAMQETPQQLADELGLPAEKLGQALIVEDAINAAMEAWKKR